MIFKKMNLEGVYLIESEKIEDERGFFARVWDSKKFLENNLNPKIVQCNISRTKLKGTIRGLHYQKNPFEENKLIRCTKGKIFDVLLDLRPTSKTFKKYEGFELSEDNHKMVYVPEGFAHGFQTLENNSEVFYQVSQWYTPSSESGIKWNDPAFQIKWPLDLAEISQKDQNWKLFKED